MKNIFKTMITLTLSLILLLSLNSFMFANTREHEEVVESVRIVNHTSSIEEQEELLKTFMHGVSLRAARLQRLGYDEQNRITLTAFDETRGTFIIGLYDIDDMVMVQAILDYTNIPIENIEWMEFSLTAEGWGMSNREMPVATRQMAIDEEFEPSDIDLFLDFLYSDDSIDFSELENSIIRVDLEPPTTLEFEESDLDNFNSRSIIPRVGDTIAITYEYMGQNLLVAAKGTLGHPNSTGDRVFIASHGMLLVGDHVRLGHEHGPIIG